jgi:hypothetical protein
VSSKYRRKQIKRQREAKKVKNEEVQFETEWDALHVLSEDIEVEAEYDCEVYIPHDHLSRRTLEAIDYLVNMGYVPLPKTEQPMGITTTMYLRGNS